MKNTLRKITVALMTVLVATILFAALPAAADEAQTGETTVTWESGFVRNTANASMAEGSLQDNATFSRTELVYVSSADVTVSWWAPYWYANTVQYVSIRDAEDAYISCGMAGTDSASSVRETRNGVNGCIYSYTTTSECYLRITVYAESTGFVASKMNEYASTLTYTLGANATENAFVCPADEIPENPTLDTSAAEALTDEQKAMLMEAVERYGVAEQATFDALCEAASAFTYDGIAARVTKGVGIRSLYTVNHAILAVSSADRITYGAIMGVGEYLGETVAKTNELTVSADANEGYKADVRGSKAVVIYDSEGASYASGKYAQILGDDYTFAYTSTFGEESMTPELMRKTELIYRGYIAVTLGDATYILYADASGDVFGKEGATYGAATSLFEASKYFREVYTDETGGAVYADNVLLKESIAAAMDSEFVFTASDFKTTDEDGSVRKGTVTYHAATETTKETVILTSSGAMNSIGNNYLSLTVEAAREGFYNVSFTGNTLGAQMHYIMWQNSSLESGKNGYQPFYNGTRIAANATRRTNYAAALGGTWTDLYTVETSFRVLPALEETHSNIGQIYLKEGTNKITLWLSSVTNAANYRAPYFGLSSLSFTMASELDTDALKLSVYNGSAIYADGYDKVSHVEGGATYPKKNDAMTLEKSNTAGIYLRAQSNISLNIPDRVWYHFSIEKSGIYEAFAALGGYEGTYEILDQEGKVIYTHAFASDPLTSTTHSCAVSYQSAGEVYLKKGNYTVRFQLTKNKTYSLHQGFFFSPTDEEVEEPAVYTLTVHYLYEDGTTAKDTLTVEYEEGVSYEVESPVIPGYKPSEAVVSGTATENREVTVIYTENRVTLTFAPVDPNGDAINGVTLGTLSVLAGNEYEYTLPTVSGYLIRETAVSGTAGYADETVSVTLYDALYDYSVAGGTISGTALETGDGYLPTVETKSLTFKITPDVSGAYAIYGVVSTKGAKVDVTAKNPTAVWGSSFTYGRIAAYTTQETTNAVPTDREEIVLAYQYLTAGVENAITLGFSETYVGVSSISFALVTPEFETADNEQIVTAAKDKTKYSSTSKGSGSNTTYGVTFDSTGSTLLRNYENSWVEYDLSIGKTGIYDIYGLISVQTAGATTLLLTNKSTGKETPLVFNAKNVIQIGGKSTSSTEIEMIKAATLYKGEYTVRITTTSGYFAFSMIRFNFVSELETGSTADGEYVTEAEGKVVSVNANYYPGFTRKAVTFSEDDGSAIYDPLFIALLNEYGFKGTFNLNATKTDYSIYAGHEVANHGCHEDGIKTTATTPYTLSTVLKKIKSMNSQLNSGIAADGNTRNDSVSSFVHPFTSGYRFLSDKVYTDAAELSALAALFTAEGKTEYTAEKLGKMTEAEIFLDYLNAIGITSNRYVSNAYGGSKNFDLPEDFMLWTPTLHQSQLKNTAQDGGYSNTYANAFRNLVDDGTLKLLYIWGHSFELVNEQYPTSSASATIKEADLVAFLNAFSGDEYYKDTVSGIREYVEATRSLIVSGGKVYNPSDLTVYVTVTVEDGEAKRIVLAPGETYAVAFTEVTLPVESDKVTLPSGSEILRATDGYDASLIWKNGTTVTLNLTGMAEGYYAVYGKVNTTHGYIAAVTLQNTTATAMTSDAAKAVQTKDTAWSGYTSGGRVLDYTGNKTGSAYNENNKDQYKVASENGYVLLGYQYFVPDANTVTVNIDTSTVGISAFKISAVAEIPSSATHILGGSYSYAEDVGSNGSGYSVSHNGAWIRPDDTLKYTVNLAQSGEYKVYMLAGGQDLGLAIEDAMGWNHELMKSGKVQVGTSSKSHVAFAYAETVMLPAGETTLSMSNANYGDYRIITFVRVGEYVAPDPVLTVRGFTHDLSVGTASASVTLVDPSSYAAVLAVFDGEGNVLAYDALVKGYEKASASASLSVALAANDVASARSVKVFSASEETLGEIERKALSKDIAAEFEYRTENGLRILVLSDEHYALDKTTRVGKVTGKTYTTAYTNSGYAGNSVSGQHNNYGVDSDTHLQAMIDAIIAENEKSPIDAVMYLGDMTDMDYWYKQFNNNPSKFGVSGIDGFYKSDYDELYYVKTEYYDQLKAYGIPFFMTLGNHDVYKDEWFFDLTKPSADYKIGDVAAVAEGVSVCYVSMTDYVVLFEKNGEKDTAFGMIASHRTAGAPLEKYLSGGATTIQHIGTDASLLQEMKDGVSEMLSVSKDYKQVFFGCHMLGDTYFSEFLAADGRIRALFMGDSHVERDYTIGATGVYNINDGSFAHTFGMQYGFDYNFAAEPWGYVILETHGTVSETYHVNPTWDYDISEARFFRYNDEEIRAKSYSEDASAAILAMLNEKAGTSYTTLKDARAAGLVTTYKNDVDAIAREDFLTRLYTAWTALGLIDGSTTDLEKAKMIRHDAESLGEIAIGQILHALMFAETTVKLGENAPGTIVKEADGTLLYCVEYRHYDAKNLYRGELLTPVEK